MKMIEKARASDLREIAKVHKKCFPEYFLTKFGEKLLMNYYGEFLADDDPFVIARDKNNNIVGFCMGYIGRSEARKRFIKKNLVSMSLKTLKLMLSFDKDVFSRLRANILPSKSSDSTPEVRERAYLLSICVLEEMRGTGLAKQLLDEFEKLMVEKKCKELVLFAVEGNSRGIGFYKNMGFDQVQVQDGEIKFLKQI